MATAYQQARLRWPDFEVSFTDFATRLLEKQLVNSPEAAISHPEDFYLACACLRHISTAIRVLETQYVDPVLKPSGQEPSREDLRQTVLAQLLLSGAHGRAKLEEYSGRGSLRTWVRVVARHVQLNLLRKRPAEPPCRLDELAELSADPTSSDPELEYTRTRYRSAFQRAFQAALGRLDARSRRVLTMQIRNARGSEIATILGVNRATVVRWMADIRRRLLVDTQDQLECELGLSRTEFESIAALLRSELEVSTDLSATTPAQGRGGRRRERPAPPGAPAQAGRRK